MNRLQQVAMPLEAPIGPTACHSPAGQQQKQCWLQVVMLFPRSFWGGLDMFGRIAPSVDQRGEFFLFYSYAHISGGALLAALVAGDSAEGFEQEDPKESARKVLRVLRGMYAPKGINIPAPLQVLLFTSLQTHRDASQSLTWAIQTARSCMTQLEQGAAWAFWCIP